MIWVVSSSSYHHYRPIECVSVDVVAWDGNGIHLSNTRSSLLRKIYSTMVPRTIPSSLPVEMFSFPVLLLRIAEGLWICWHRWYLEPFQASAFGNHEFDSGTQSLDGSSEASQRRILPVRTYVSFVQFGLHTRRIHESVANYKVSSSIGEKDHQLCCLHRCWCYHANVTYCRFGGFDLNIFCSFTQCGLLGRLKWNR